MQELSFDILISYSKNCCVFIGLNVLSMNIFELINYASNFI